MEKTETKTTTAAARLTFLGTGNAFVTHRFNTCFVLDAGESRLLVDAGGGNGILSQLERAHIALSSLHDLYLTHAHTDHVLGAVWVLRAVVNATKKNAYEGILNVWGHERVLMVLQTICDLTLSAKDKGILHERIRMHVLSSGDRFRVGGLELTVFDILSTKEKQFGFRTQLPDGRTLVCLGDEPYNAANRRLVEGADCLLAEAFCLYADRDRFHPYEKHHSTARDAALLAEELGVKHLVLYHTEDKTPADRRREAYTLEAQEVFHGRVSVPEDLEVIEP